MFDPQILSAGQKVIAWQRARQAILQGAGQGAEWFNDWSVAA